MVRISSALPLLAVALSASAAEIPAGSHVLLKMVNTISTRTAQAGDYVYLTPATPIVAAGNNVVPVGSYVQGVVAHSLRSGRVKGRAELGLRFDSLTLPTGGQVKFSPRLNSTDPAQTGQKVESRENSIRQAPTRGQDVKQIAIFAGAGALLGNSVDRGLSLTELRRGGRNAGWEGLGIGAGAGAAVGVATVLLTRGKEVELRQGTTLDVVFDRPLNLE